MYHIHYVYIGKYSCDRTTMIRVLHTAAGGVPYPVILLRTSILQRTVPNSGEYGNYES